MTKKNFARFFLAALAILSLLLAACGTQAAPTQAAEAPAAKRPLKVGYVSDASEDQ